MPHPPHPLATLAQITKTPSENDGLPPDLERDLRIAGCMLIQEAGIMLSLPQSTMATAQVLFHRFYYVSSMLSFGVNDIAISSLYLSSKLNETPVRLRDLINTFIYLSARIKHLLSLPTSTTLSLGSASRDKGDGLGEGSDSMWRIGLGSSSSSNGKGKEKESLWEGFQFTVPGFHDEVFWDWKDVIVGSEMQILKRLGFNMQVDLPYSHVINYCKILDLVFEANVAQTCWSILNDALLTPLYAIHPPHTLACTAILLTARLLRIPLPDDWWVLFDVEYEDIWICSGTIMKLWYDWGVAPSDSLQKGDEEGLKRWEEGKKDREARWRRAWILAESRRSVRKWVEERKA